MNRRLLIRAGIGLVGLSAFAAVAIPKSAWEALMMEVSSEHNARWQRDANGQLVATSKQSPDQSYKPILPNPQSPLDYENAKLPPLSVVAPDSDISGDWDITVDDGGYGKDLVRLWVHVEPSGNVSYHCVSVSGSDPGDCSGYNESIFSLNIGPPAGMGACNTDDRFRPIHLESVGPGRYYDKQEHFFACDPHDDQRKIHDITVQVSGNSLTGLFTDLGIRGHCNPDCDDPSTPFSGSRLSVAPRN
jgi:hypothetical protein